MIKEEIFCDTNKIAIYNDKYNISEVLLIFIENPTIILKFAFNYKFLNDTGDGL